MSPPKSDYQGRDLKLLILSKGGVWTIFILYAAILLASIYITIVLHKQYFGSDDKETLALWAGIMMSLAGSSIAYSRRLYSACINNTYTFLDNVEDFVLDKQSFRRIGTYAFFAFRPLFGIAFSILIYAFWRLTIAASGTESVKLANGFLYTTMTLGFISGFMVGRAIDLLEGYGAKRIETLLGGEF